MTKSKKWALAFTESELQDLSYALEDAGKLIDERLECGRKYGDYDEEEMAEMGEYAERLEALAKRIGRMLLEHGTEVRE